MYHKAPEQCKLVFDRPNANRNREVPSTLHYPVDGATGRATGEHEEALKAFKTAMNLPGSRPDVVRTRTLSGPSPVGGSAGGTEGKLVMSLDEFEMQAAHYNIACAYARLRNVPESVANLKVAFDCGFDNYATVRSDPDLSEVHGTAEFEALMDRYDKKGLFGFFGK